MKARAAILYVNFSLGAKAEMFRRRLDGIRRHAGALGFEVVALGAADCSPEDVPSKLRSLRPVGCVAETPRLSPRLFAGTPTVFIDVPDTAQWREAQPFVRCDETAIAESAFAELSYGAPPVYAVVPYWQSGQRWSQERSGAFQTLCRRAGAECLVFDTGRDRTEEAFRKRLGPWIASLPGRCAIFAVNDGIAADVALALGAAHRFMPYDATLVGANGGAPSKPAMAQIVRDISSVKIDFELSGYLAAKALFAFASNEGFGCARNEGPRRRESAQAPVAMHGGVATFGQLLVDRRKSTRGRGRSEHFVARAMETIRREACDGLTTADLVRRSRVSERLFYLRFREAMGHTAHDEILQVRLERVFTLLAETDTSIGAISDMCGFGSQVELRKVFRRRMGASMTAWRALHRR